VRKPITGTHSGTGWWLAQRVSALILFIAGSGLLLGFWFAAPFDFAAWQAAFRHTSLKLLVWLVVASLCLHAWIGLRDVLMDYMKPVALRLTANVLVLLVLALCMVWTTVIVWDSNG
jgi:succinate dehydrogenase / fumarate reductase membrane anchor subunit